MYRIFASAFDYAAILEDEEGQLYRVFREVPEAGLVEVDKGQAHSYMCKILMADASQDPTRPEFSDWKDWPRYSREVQEFTSRWCVLHLVDRFSSLERVVDVIEALYLKDFAESEEISRLREELGSPDVGKDVIFDRIKELRSTIAGRHFNQSVVRST